MSRTVSVLGETPPRAGRAGFTLVELLVVVAVVALLLALLLPAVQGARESARVAKCQNNVRELANAILHHDASLGHLPSGGWGPRWLPVAERGSDSAQPGGWLYSTLPYFDEAATHDVIKNATAATAFETLASCAVPALSCPTRRTNAPRRLPSDVNYRTPFTSSLKLPTGVVTDYAANGGSMATCPPLDLLWKALTYVGSAKQVTFCHVPPNKPEKDGNTQTLAISAIQTGHGGANHSGDHIGPCATCDDDMATLASDPASLDEGDQWRRLHPLARIALPDAGIPDIQDGVVCRMSRVTAAGITDGLSNTYLVGEKYVAADRYDATATPDAGDNRPFVAGYSSSAVRWAYDQPAKDAPGLSQPNVFGSAHVAGWVVAFADGSVATYGFDIDPAVHKALAARNDGALVTRPW